MKSLPRAWKEDGHKKHVEKLSVRSLDYFNGRALITQGAGAYAQLLAPTKGVIQINLLSSSETFGVYTVRTNQIPDDVRQCQEPNLAMISGLEPTKC